MVRILSLLAGGLVLWSATSLHAQDALLAQLYGSGVHAYFSRDYVRSHEYFTDAIAGGTADPRAYYFRGMACMRLGRPEDAELDYQKGAELESRDVNKIFDVGQSLERVQGAARLTLERYRVKARLAARERAEQLHRARYEAIRAEEDRLLEQPPATPPGTPTPSPTTPGPAPTPTPDDPFGVGLPGTPAPGPGVEPGPAPTTEPAAPPTAEPPAEPVAQPLAPPTAEPAAEPAPAEPAAGPAPAEPAPADPFAIEAPPAQPTAPPTPAPGLQPAPPPTIPPAPGPAPPPVAQPGAPKKSGGILGALGRALGKAAAGDQGGAAIPLPPGGVDVIQPTPPPGAPGPAEPTPSAPPAADDPFADLPPPAAPPTPEPGAPPAAPPAAPPPAEPTTPAPATPAPSDDPFAG